MPAQIKRQGTLTSRALVLDPTARIRQLSEHGSSVAIDKDIPVKRYFRSGSEMERQARVYYTEGQWDRAFILYNKFATLFIEKLPKHPEYSKAPGPDKSRIKKLLKQALPRAMELKEKLKVRYDKEKEEMEKVIQQEEEAERAKKQAAPKKPQRTDQSEEPQRTDQSKEIEAFFGGQGGVSTDSVATPSASQGPESISYPPPQGDSNNVESRLPPPQGELDTGMGRQQELLNQYPTSQSGPSMGSKGETTPSTAVSDEPPVKDEREERTATDSGLAHVLPIAPPPAFTDLVPSAPPPSAPPPSALQQAPLPSTLQHQPPPTLPPPSYTQTVGMAPQTGLPPAAQGVPPTALGIPMHQGGVPTQTPAAQQSLRQPTYESSIFQSPFAADTPSPGPTTLPTPPAQYNQFSPTYGYHGQPPPSLQQQGGPPQWSQMYQPQNTRPATSPIAYLSSGSSSGGTPTSPPSGPPQVDRTSKPDSLKALSTGWGGMDGYRPVYIPTDTASRFEEVADSNTQRNVETCGILAGKLSQNKLRITHIIVPKQKGKADSCETLNEEELFDVQDQYDLITLGWIHTHPTQTAFMSSVDLHCHCSYQIMMDEAVAIVVAPKYKQIGYFMLTEPHGLNYITHCEEEGFHVHPKEPPLYEDCKHIHHDPNTFIQIVDLR